MTADCPSHQYLQKKYIDNADEYVLPPYSSLADCAIRTLTTHNIDCGNAWTMAILALIAGYYLKKDTRWPFIVLSVPIIIHACIAFLFHAFKAYSYDTWCKWGRHDGVMILVAQFFIHVGLHAGLPWTISILICTAYGLFIYHAITQINELEQNKPAEPIVLQYIPVASLMHWVPVLLTTWDVKAILTGVAHCLTMGAALVMYILHIPERFTHSVKYGTSHEYMHIGLWCSYIFHHRMVTILL